MSVPKLISRNHGPIREVRLNRPEVHNAFDKELIAELDKAFAEVAREAKDGGDVRGVVVTSEGRSFCAGADLNYMSAIAEYGEAENKEDARALSAMFRSIRNCPVYVIARIQGAALGGATGLIAACDLAVASERAKFGFTEVLLGIVPAVISPFVLDRIGLANGRALFPTGERFTAEEALRIGLVDRVVAPDKLDDAIESVLQSLLAAAPAASREAKQLIGSVGPHLPLHLAETSPVFETTASLIARLRAEPEGQEGMKAFLEKRPAEWVAKAPRVGPEVDPPIA